MQFSLHASWIIFLENPDFSVFLFIKIRNENVLDQYIGSARKDIKHKCIS